MSRDNRTQLVVESILPFIETHRKLELQKNVRRPYILGVTGLQGSGKSHLASALVVVLSKDHNYNTIEVSLDDFYLTHEEQKALRTRKPSNSLLKARGQPGTHDSSLLKSFFSQFSDPSTKSIWIPSFDKSLFQGEGDRLPQSEWKTINCHSPIDVVIFEGWCVGFQPCSEIEVEMKRAKALQIRHHSNEPGTSITNGLEDQFSIITLRNHELVDLLHVNDCLRTYSEDFMGPQHFDFMVHLDTDDLVNVYSWRMQQEHALRMKRGTGMTDEGVVEFVQIYMPAYELYLDGLRSGFFKEMRGTNKTKGQLQLVMGAQRNVVKSELF
ncbi:hypothetical protein V494_08540 [Pseudogymnoascus sp. VKM F-4513 (FW-928)]|nr:hypothetical protein V494_08540 [Pseudogymnoascus sp. VKM F-4513 (FW-928)]